MVTQPEPQIVAETETQVLPGLHNPMPLTGKLYPPHAVLQRLHRAFPMDRFDCYFTIAYVSLNVRTGQVTYGNAGHMPPIVLREDGRLDVLTRHDTVIGSGFDVTFGQETATLAPEDRLILYTDGLTDNFGEDGMRFGRDRLFEVLRGLGGQPMEDIVAAVMTAARRLRGDAAPDDDVSLMAVA